MKKPGRAAHTPDCAGCPTCGRPRRDRNLFRTKAMIDPVALADALAFDPKLTAKDVRVAVAIIGALDYENRLLVSQAELARRLGILPSVMSRHVARLRKAGVLVATGPGPGGHPLLRFNAAYLWKGRAERHGHYFYPDKEVAEAKREANARRRRAKLHAVEGGGVERPPTAATAPDLEPA